MSKIIEILDSDDDMPEEPLPQEKLAAKAADPVEAKEISPPDLNKKESNNIPITPTTVASNTQQALSSPTKPRSRHRRKSTHQHMRASPEMQFETISLDDDDDVPSAPDSTNIIQNSKPTKAFKTTPKILGTKPPTTEEAIETDFEDFLGNDEISAMVRQIAEERIRINFLLASYGMPDISFSLYSNYERLKFQFDDRVKQRKMRSWNRSVDTKLTKRKTQEGN